MSGVPRIILDDGELKALDELLDEVCARHSSIDAETFLAEAAVLAHDLPRRLREFVSTCRLAEEPAFVVSGYEIDDDRIGPTPEHWRTARDSATAHRQETLLVLCGSLLGDVYAFVQLQDGRMVNDVLPVPGHERHVSALSSELDLLWHTEEAGYDCRPDHQGFICLRNPDGLPTTFSRLDPERLPADVVDVLFQARFRRAPLAPESPEWVTFPVLTGPRSAPYLQIDPDYMVGTDAEAEAAFMAAADAIDAAVMEVPQRPGDISFIDNKLAVHGRSAFTPRYDGTDRWIKRIKIARDLRRSRRLRASSAARVVNVPPDWHE